MGARRSLVSQLAMVSGGLFVLAFAVFLISYDQLRRVTNERAALRTRLHAMDRATDRVFTALVNQEVGLRGYWVTGDRQFLTPYDAGVAEERRAWNELIREDASAEPAQAAAIDALQAAVDTWRREVVVPQLEVRAAGPLPGLDDTLRAGKQRFDLIRARHADLVRLLRARSDEAFGAIQRRVGTIHVVVAVTAIGSLLAGVLVLGYVLRQSARPIRRLAALADARQPFPPPDEAIAAREIYALAASLHRLDTAARDREKELSTAHAEAVALGKFAEHIQQVAREDELHGAFAKLAARVTGAQEIRIVARNASKNRLEVMHPDMPVEIQAGHAVLSDPMRCRAVRTLREVTEDAESPTACQCSFGVPAAGSYACTPMLAAGELVGLVNLRATKAGHFTPERRRALQGYAGFAGATLSSLRLLASARDRALRDGLTGAYNRAFLGEYLGKLLARAQRTGARIAVLMLDLDHFKRINDSHGHQTGDNAIIAFARTLQAATRGSDAVVRYGGEEFVVVLVDVDAAAAQATANRIRAAVATTPISGPGGDLGTIVRCSIGVAMFPDHGPDEAALIAAADAALYKAKSDGRDRVVVAGVRPPDN